MNSDVIVEYKLLGTAPYGRDGQRRWQLLVFEVAYTDMGVAYKKLVDVAENTRKLPLRKYAERTYGDRIKPELDMTPIQPQLF